MVRKSISPLVAIVLVVSALSVGLAIWEAIAPYVPHAFYGVSFTPPYRGAGKVTRVYPAELPRGVQIAIGDRVLENPEGDLLRGYRLHIPEFGDAIHVSTASGIVVLHATADYYASRDAVGEALREGAEAVVLVCAALLFARRPGWMSFAFWIWAMSGLAGADLDYALDWLPRPVGVVFDLLYWASTYSGLALISFALRFPSGKLSARLRWVEVAAWSVLCGSAVVEIAQRVLVIEGLSSNAPYSDLRMAAFPMLAAAGILLWKQAHADRLARSRIVWASTAFVGAAVARAVAFLMVAGSDSQNWRLVLLVSNLLPLLAIYPILRYRLFDLGFVVSRAALYSMFTLAVFGALAAANWFAQHVVTERLAFVLQPVAAIAIGLGYFRVRGWLQSSIERVVFRERFASEQALEATIHELPFIERAQDVDAVLATEVARTLRLASAALFRRTDQSFERVAAVGWDGDTVTQLSRDDVIASSLSGEARIIQLRSIRWEPSGLPSLPNAPVLAVGIVRRNVLSAIALYGRHENGTELEPEEVRLLRRVGDAAAIAYETAEANDIRERMKLLEERLRKFESVPLQ